MKRYLSLFAIAAITFVSCNKEDLTIPEEPVADRLAAPSVIHARTESNSQTDTKAHWNNNLKVLWNAGDEISMFNRNTYNIKYRFKGADNDPEGDFEKVGEDQGEPVFNTVFAVYPYSSAISAAADGSGISLTIPANQTYSEGSFDPGANIMVAARGPMSEEDTDLEFKNACGYLRIKLYGDDVTVSSITLEGRNGEKIAGEATITQAIGGLPSVTVGTGGTSGITLTCSTPVSVGTTAATAAEFNFVIPPVTFSGGIKITVRGTSGGEEAVFLKSTSNSIEVSRNVRRTMAALKLDGDILSVRFDDDAFEEYCLENFDSDSDGLISTEEAQAATSINLNKEAYHYTIQSLGGLECFTNLTFLDLGEQNIPSINLSTLVKLELFYCYNSIVEQLDFSNNPELKDVIFQGGRSDQNEPLGQLASVSFPDNQNLERLWIIESNALTNIDLSHCPALKDLNVQNNQLTSIDVSANTELEWLQCSYNKIESLSIAHSNSLKRVYCGSNPFMTSVSCTYCPALMTCDVTDNTALKSLELSSTKLEDITGLKTCTVLEDLICQSGKVSTLDVSNMTSLKKLRVAWNQMTSLNVSGCTALKELICRQNDLTSLDVSTNTALETLQCENNSLSSLDVTSNIALKELWCLKNSLQTLDLRDNRYLEILRCNDNQLRSVDLQYLNDQIHLTEIYIHNNSLNSLSLTKLTALEKLYCDNNQMSSLNVVNNTSLTVLAAWADGKIGSINTLTIGSSQSITYLGEDHSTVIDPSQQPWETLILAQI